MPTAQIDLGGCPGCRAAPNTPHHVGCDHAHCPGCGQQELLCGDCCEQAEQESLWHGIDPDEHAAIRGGLYYWHNAPDIQQWIPDATRARAVYEWDPTAQRFLVDTAYP